MNVSYQLLAGAVLFPELVNMVRYCRVKQNVDIFATVDLVSVFLEDLCCIMSFNTDPS